MMNMNDDGSENDARSTISSSSRAERRRILRDGAEKHRINTVSKGEKWDVEADAIHDRRSDELLRGKIIENFEYLSVYDEKEEIGMRMSGRVVERRNIDVSDTESFQSAQRMVNEGVRYSKDGSSNFFARSSYHYENSMSNRNGMNGFDDVDYVGEDRAESLKDQLNRPGNKNKGKEKVPHDRRVAHQEPYASENWDTDALQYSYPESQFKRSHYQNQYTDDPPLIHRQEMGGNGYYSSQHPRAHAQGYVDPLRSQMLRRNPYQNPAHYQHQHYHTYMPGRHMNDGMVYIDKMGPDASDVRSDKLSEVSNDMTFNYRGNHGSYGLHEYNQRISNSQPLRSHNPQLHTRWASDTNSGFDGFNRRHPHRMHLASSGHHCRPYAGGAPFITCYNCFELLMLPKKVLSQINDRKKMRCGECYTVIVFAVSNKNLVVLTDDAEVEEMDIPVNSEKNPVPISTHGDGRLNQARIPFSSNDYDNSGYDYQSMDRERGQLSIGHQRDNWLTNAENSTAAREDYGSVDLADKDNGQPPPSDSPGDKLLPNNASVTQNLTSNTSLATEIDISSNEYINTGTTFDSGEGSRGDHQKRSRAVSFLSVYKDKTFKDSNVPDQTAEPEKANVTVNGHLIPDRLIRRAEKLAGLIEPGHYWYDFRAGFWGVMGGSCMGIIPPFIAEFNYPMADNCSRGNTGVFVNGRELSQKDLNLLGQRGLPLDSDKSYVIEISGRILDADTGEELPSLGKLAPSVEKAKRGFGMRDPNAPAQRTNL